MQIFHHDCHIGMHTCYISCRRSCNFRRWTRFRGAGTWQGRGIYHANYKGTCNLLKIKRDRLIALGYKKKSISESKACMDSCIVERMHMMLVIMQVWVWLKTVWSFVELVHTCFTILSSESHGAFARVAIDAIHARCTVDACVVHAVVNVWKELMQEHSNFMNIDLEATCCFFSMGSIIRG